jgi:hypothetical protein
MTGRNFSTRGRRRRTRALIAAVAWMGLAAAAALPAILRYLNVR